MGTSVLPYRSAQSSGPTETTGILLVSPNAGLRYDLRARLQSERWSLLEASSGAEALAKIETHNNISLILLDPGLPDLKVDDFKEIVGELSSNLTIVPINPHTAQPLAVAPSPDSLCFQVLRQIGRGSPLSVSTSFSPDRVSDSSWRSLNGLPGFIGKADSVQRVGTMVRLVAPRDTTVLITGESGTGKDLIARAVHQLSSRRQKPFVIINCAAIPEALLEAELFGYVKGAFTGAMQSRIGRIHSAQGGTLFLDEIGDLPLGLQSKLLRFLEQGEVQRLGSDDTFRVDVRVVTATNAHLRQLVQQKQFREDLFYRLSIFPIELCPLRERFEDLSMLAEYFLAKFCPQQTRLSREASAILHQHTWPGNVRELRNVMERAAILAGQEEYILPQHIVI